MEALNALQGPLWMLDWLEAFMDALVNALHSPLWVSMSRMVTQPLAGAGRLLGLLTAKEKDGWLGFKFTLAWEVVLQGFELLFHRRCVTQNALNCMWSCAFWLAGCRAFRPAASSGRIAECASRMLTWLHVRIDCLPVLLPVLTACSESR